MLTRVQKIITAATAHCKQTFVKRVNFNCHWETIWVKPDDFQSYFLSKPWISSKRSALEYTHFPFIDLGSTALNKPLQPIYTRLAIVSGHSITIPVPRVSD